MYNFLSSDKYKHQHRISIQLLTPAAFTAVTTVMVSRFLLVVLCRYFVPLRATTFPGCTPVSSVFHIEAGDNLFSSVNLLDDTEIVGNLNWIYAFVAHFWLQKSKFRMSSSHASPPAIRWKTLSKCGTVLLCKLFCILQKWSPAKSNSKRSPVSCIVSKSFFMLKRQCCWPNEKEVLTKLLYAGHII